MTPDEMCRWLEVPAATPVPRKIAEALGSIRRPVTAEEDKAALSACLAWTPPRTPLPLAAPAPFNASAKTWAGFSF